MRVEEFLEKHNYAPYEFVEVVELLVQVTDNKDLVKEAKAFLDAKENLEMMLNDIGFEFG